MKEIMFVKNIYVFGRGVHVVELGAHFFSKSIHIPSANFYPKVRIRSTDTYSLGEKAQ
jgi:hypothetical protein